MRSLQAYVRHQGWLKRLRSLDSAHERWELERSTKGREERTEDIRKHVPKERHRKGKRYEILGRDRKKKRKT